jgi:hypothetical protein
MSSKTRVLVLLIGLGVMAVAGFTIAFQSAKTAVRTASSAVWGS